MNILLDTHIAIWALNDSPELSSDARKILLDPDNNIYYSSVSVWEVLLKHSKHPNNIPFDERDFSKWCKDAGFIPLNLSDKHILTVRTPRRTEGSREHNDPFDRLLLSQAKTENMSFMTHDELIGDYNEKCIVLV